jgi:hypothetical protein
MAASIKAFVSTGATEAGARVSAETGAVFNRVDSLAGTTPIPIPTATGTNYSYYKSMYLYCDSATGAGTSISTKQVNLNGAPATGLAVVYKDVTDTYTQATAVLAADASGGSPPATPATYTVMTTSPVTYDAASDTSANATRMGDILQVGLAVGSNYAGGAGAAQAVPSIVFTYTEA